MNIICIFNEIPKLTIAKKGVNNYGRKRVIKPRLKCITNHIWTFLACTRLVITWVGNKND